MGGAGEEDGGGDEVCEGVDSWIYQYVYFALLVIEKHKKQPDSRIGAKYWLANLIRANQ